MIYLELTEGDSHEYDNFNDLMESRNVFKKIQDEKSMKWYDLPKNFYHYKGEITDRETIYNHVVQTVNEKGLEIFELIVITSSGATWEGLSLRFF